LPTNDEVAQKKLSKKKKKGIMRKRERRVKKNACLCDANKCESTEKTPPVSTEGAAELCSLSHQKRGGKKEKRRLGSQNSGRGKEEPVEGRWTHPA